MRSMGEITQSAAKPMASLARRGTCGSWRSRRVIVTQAGRKPARSRRIPGGSRRARTTRTTHEAIQAPVAISRMRIMRSTPAVLPCGAGRRRRGGTWHRAHVSNGPTEANNNLIKRVKRVAFGFRRFAHYRIRALLYAGKPNWDLLATITPR